MDSKDAGTKKDTGEHAKREKGLDQTLADSFPSSDPPSTIPDPIMDGAVENGPVETGFGPGGKADIALRKNAQSYLDRAGIKLDLERFERNIRQQPLIAVALVTAAGFIFGVGRITRLGAVLLPLRSCKGRALSGNLRPVRLTASNRA